MVLSLRINGLSDVSLVGGRRGWFGFGVFKCFGILCVCEGKLRKETKDYF